MIKKQMKKGDRLTRQINVVVDIEASGRLSKDVFAVAMAASCKEKYMICEVVYFPESRELDKEGDTYKWWTGDEQRKAFFEESHKEENQVTRKVAAEKIRAFMNQLYTMALKEDRDIVLFSDFSTFDLGMTNTLLEEYDMLPLYMHTEDSYPLECVDFTTWVKAKAGLLPLDSSNTAFELLNIKRNKTTDSHNSLEDIKLLSGTVDNVMNQLLNE